MKKNLIIFDCFGVLCSELAPVWFSRHFDEEEAIRAKNKYFSKADIGEYSIEEVLHLLSNEYNIEYKIIVDEFKDIFTLNKDLIELIRKLKKHNKIAILSNAPEGLLENVLKSFNSEGLFDEIVVSWKFKKAKPDLDIYRHCLSLFNEDFENIYMIDDNIKNLRPVEALGIQPILYKDFDIVKKTLEVLL